MLSEIKSAIRIFLLEPIREFISGMKEYGHLVRLKKTYERKEIINNTIVFNILRNNRNSLDTEGFLALSLALNGAKVKILIDDGMMMHWDSLTIYSIKNFKRLHKKNLNLYSFNAYEKLLSPMGLAAILRIIMRKKAIKSYQDKNIEYIYYSKMIDRENINYKNLNELRKHAESGTIKFFHTCDLDYSEESVKYYYKISLMNSVLSRNVVEYIINTIKPDVCINAHGIYSIHGPAFELLLKNGLNSLVFAGANTHASERGSVNIMDMTRQMLSSSKLWEQYKEKPVTNEMRNQVEQFFNKRLKGETLDMKIMSLIEKDKYLKVNKDDGYKYHIAIFPNVLWDGNIGNRHLVFAGYLEWIEETINYVKTRKDIKLYIKSHPSETILTLKSERLEIALNKRVNLKKIENIELILPENKIDTYEFLRSGIDLALIYDGFLGIEISYMGIPTITCVKGGFSSIEKGNFTVSNKEEYFSFLENIDEIIEDYKNNFKKHYYDNIIRYLYWYIFEVTMIIPPLKYAAEKGIYLLCLKKEHFNLDLRILNLLN